MSNSSPAPADFRRTTLVRGLVWFLVLTVAGLAVLFAFTFHGDAARVLQRVSPAFLLLALGGAVVDLLVGAVRYQIFLRRIRPGTSLWLPVRADLANRFVSAVTPSQTGGGPAQVFVLWRGGIPVPEALSFLLVNFLSTLVFFLLAGGCAAWAFRDAFPGGAIHWLVTWGFVAFAVSLSVMLAAFFRPEVVARPLSIVAEKLRPAEGRLARALVRVCDGGVDAAGRYRAACREFVRDAPHLPVLSFVLTVALYLNKFTLAWLVLRGLGAEASWASTVSVQALLHFILYVAPSPGGSGIAELSTGALMALLLPGHLLAPFTLCYRFFLLYLPATVGAFVMMFELRPRTPTARAAPAVVAVLTLMLGAAAVSAQTDAGSDAPSVEAVVLQGMLAVDRDAADAAYAQAVALARSEVARAPDDADAHYWLAVALGEHLHHQGLRTKFRMAGEVRAEAERALELDPGHAGAHHVLGRLNAGAMRLNRVARAIAREVFGASVLEGASWEQAEYHFSEARRLEPCNPRHAMELGVLYMDTHRPELAEEALLSAVQSPVRGVGDSLAVVRARALLASLDGK
jgi:uncharacterized protein (TIRG00374 family)